MKKSKDYHAIVSSLIATWVMGALLVSMWRFILFTPFPSDCSIVGAILNRIFWYSPFWIIFAIGVVSYGKSALLELQRKEEN